MCVLTESFIREAQAKINVLLERAIEGVKTSTDETSVILVGGGTILTPDVLSGASGIVKPPFYEVANVVSAACSQIRAKSDIIESTKDRTIKQITENACSLAIARAVNAGAVKSSVTIAEFSTIPIPYLADQVRVLVKAIVDLNLSTYLTVEEVEDFDIETEKGPRK
jgi:hypothetical protein